MSAREQAAIERVHEATVALADATHLPVLGARLTESLDALLGGPEVHLYLDDGADGLAHLAGHGGPSPPSDQAPPKLLALPVAATARGGALAEALGRPFAGSHLLVHDGAPIGVLLWLGEAPEGPLVPEALLAGFLAVASALLGARLEVQRSFAQSERDALTGLYSRAHYEGRLVEEVARAVRHERAIALLLLEIDDLESRRDALSSSLFEGALLRLSGLIAGDEPEVIHAREGDVAARLDPGLFALLLPDTPKSGALVKADRVRAAVAESLQGTGACSITVSVGVAGFPDDAMDARSLHQAAEAALAAARVSGGNRISQA